ncbi:MAG: S-layer homology domain-containing protein [Acidimicrobiia bacterium]|nr:S-layer homology domain-containing protein [Acidimicrobiia bacterium]MDH5503131.1 S-layer homology domain-containing protein [Acidimicrobiia bacterium]
MKRAWTKYALVALVTALVVAPAVAVASHGFTDVPDSHLFHNNIQWMKDNGVTLGCNPPANDKYCPNNTVNRGQMAAFMQRLAENKVVDAATAVTAETATLATTATNANNSTQLNGQASSHYENPVAAIVVGGVNLPLNTVVEVGEVTASAPAAGALIISATLTPNTSTAGQVTYWLQVDNATCDFGGPFFSVFWGRLLVSGGQWGSTTAISAVTGVDAGSHTVTFCARTWDGGTIPVNSSLIAQFSADATFSGTVTAAPGSGGSGTP